MSEVITLPKVHRNYYTNTSVQEMLKMGFSIADTLEVHGDFFSGIADKCSDQSAIIGEHLSENDLHAVFMRAFGRKLDSLTTAEYEQKKRRAAYFKKIPARKLRAMTPADWEKAVGRAALIAKG